MAHEIELLVLDVHGIVLNAHWPNFLREVARHTGEPYDQVTTRWHNHVREDAWSGRIDDRELWHRLTLSDPETREWREIMESGYRAGPAAPYVGGWALAVPVWLLSNHRTHWLLPRLKRFGLDSHFERVLVSDMIGVAKPDPAAFRDVLGEMKDADRVLFVDDQTTNVETARRLGMQAIHAAPGTPWQKRIDRMLEINPARQTVPGTTSAGRGG